MNRRINILMDGGYNGNPTSTDSTIIKKIFYEMLSMQTGNFQQVQID